VRVSGLASVAARRSDVRTWRADLFLLEFSSSRSVEVATLLSASQPAAGIVAYRVPPSLDAVLNWESLRICRRVGLDASAAELARAVGAVLGVEMPADGEHALVTDPRCELTRREREILDLVSEGRSNAEIAAALRLQYSTVKNHVHSILLKLDARGRGEAAAWYRRRSVACAARFRHGGAFHQI
jgi:two-component system, NarL family, nitrate/nitrite response regulator NarL